MCSYVLPTVRYTSIPYSIRRYQLYKLQMWISRSSKSESQGADGKEVDLSQVTSSSKAETRVYEVIKDSDEMRGVLTTGDYMCPKCDCVEVYSYLEQTRSHLMNLKPEC